jgi:glutamate synthase domain-containing protein 2
MDKIKAKYAEEDAKAEKEAKEAARIAAGEEKPESEAEEEEKEIEIVLNLDEKAMSLESLSSADMVDFLKKN